MKTLNIIFLSFIFLSFLTPFKTKRQVFHPFEKYANLDSIQKRSQNVRVVFWNVENLYDPYDDTTKLDDEFTSAGMKHWTYSRFKLKLNHLAKTILGIGQWEPPAIIGMCEVENRYVLNKLVFESPLKPFKYRFAHHDSPDLRGVDVALLYRPELFKLISSKSFCIRFPFDTTAQTREILMVKGCLNNHDTMIVFVNHWPSRRGGALASQPRRNYVGTVLHTLTDSILSNDPLSNILIMGDFNDEPDCQSITAFLQARTDTTGMRNSDLVNLMFPKMNKEGTHKFQGNWAILDQFIVSGSLFQGSKYLKADYSDVHIYKGSFLLKEDQKFFGDTPKRTYTGPKHTGGFSDHLPVYLDIRSLIPEK